jgi:hypothetical protein
MRVSRTGGGKEATDGEQASMSEATEDYRQDGQ